MHVIPTQENSPTDVAFSYTIGLTVHHYPEPLMVALDPQVAHHLLNDVAARVYDKAQRFTHGQRISDLIDGYDAIVVDGDPTEQWWPGVAVARYGREQVRLQRIVWPDPQGRFPWDPGYGLEPHVQPLIARL
jgi:uncharacterized protein DUF4262